MELAIINTHHCTQEHPQNLYESKFLLKLFADLLGYVPVLLTHEKKKKKIATSAIKSNFTESDF